MANLSRKSSSSSSSLPQLRSRTELNDLGTIQISEDVVAAVVRKYTLSVPGVARMVGQSIVGGLANIIGKKVHDRAIRVDVDGELVNITVNIIVRFGEHVPTVATTVQQVSRKYVEQLTGQKVGRVNVIVQNLESDDEEHLPELDEPEEDPSSETE
jgi:uncharacterized alkaline shock family protein YloU